MLGTADSLRSVVANAAIRPEAMQQKIDAGDQRNRERLRILGVPMRHIMEEQRQE
jgi:hypothetical protein